MSTAGERTLGERVDALFEARSEAMAEIYDLYDDLRAAGRFYQHGPTRLVTGYDGVKALIRDNVRLSNQALKQGTRAEAVRARLSEEGQGAFDEVSAFEQNFL